MRDVGQEKISVEFGILTPYARRGDLLRRRIPNDRSCGSPQSGGGAANFACAKHSPLASRGSGRLGWRRSNGWTCKLGLATCLLRSLRRRSGSNTRADDALGKEGEGVCAAHA